MNPKTKERLKTIGWVIWITLAVFLYLTITTVACKTPEPGNLDNDVVLTAVCKQAVETKKDCRECH